MADVRHGYNVSVAYTANFFPEMAPHWLDFCLRAQGFEPRRTSPSFRYLDLGCGQGFHVCLLAAANPQAEFVGIDFDADHVAHGQELAAAAGLTNVDFIQADFIDLAGRWPTELGTFDYMVLQGILSWVSGEVRAAVFQCVAQASKPGTLAAFGYNSPPGWLTSVPFQHVANRLSRGSDADTALEGTIKLFRRLRDGKGQLFERMPHFKTHLEMLAAQPASYLAHELLPDHWEPLWHSDVAQQLRDVDFSFVGSATIAEALLPDSLPGELAAIIRDQADPSLRQDVQDVVIMQPFRRDIFCREPLVAESANNLDEDAPAHLMAMRQEGAPVQFRTSFGGLTVDYAVIADIVAALADGPKPISALMALKNPTRPDTRSILLSMLHARMLAVGTPRPVSAAPAARFNAAVARATAGGTTYQHLAAAELGSGLPATELNLLLIDTWLSVGRSSNQEELARGVVQRLDALGRQLQFRGSLLADDELQSHIARLTPVFVDQLVPQWRRLGVLE